MESDRSSDDNRHLTSVRLSKEAMDSFTCSICLELLYKPIVTACGHIFCFWCGHHGMYGFKASSCPLCRRPYIYFPNICKLLHCMLMKIAPDEYLRRQHDIRCHEVLSGMFSPEFPPLHSSTLTTPELEIGDFYTILNANAAVSDSKDQDMAPERGYDHQCRQEGAATSSLSQGSLVVEDACCALCNGLLYHPVVLNCGDVFCEMCLKAHTSKVLKCPSCGAPHPTGYALVCLELDRFLQSAFPSEYANRQRQHSGENIPFTACDAVDRTMESLHIGVGCDGCGMFPIMGDRYQCEDCEEIVGFDLCGSCYNNNGSWMGRFNQKHLSTHRMEQVE